MSNAMPPTSDRIEDKNLGTGKMEIHFRVQCKTEACHAHKRYECTASKKTSFKVDIYIKVVCGGS